MEVPLKQLTLKEAMDVAEVTQKTIYNWCEEKHFKFVRAVNRRLYIDRESFFVFLKKRAEEYNKGGGGGEGTTENDVILT
jgi:hypothetical protein